MINQDDFDKVRLHLRQLGNREAEPDDDRYGICEELKVAFGVKWTVDARFKLVHELRPFEWLTRSSVYLIGGVKEFHRTDDDDNDGSLWADDEWGNKRRRLCLWLADNLKIEELEYCG